MSLVVLPPELSQIAQINLAVFAWLKLSITHSPAPSPFIVSLLTEFPLGLQRHKLSLLINMPCSLLPSLQQFSAYVPFIIFLCSGGFWKPVFGF